ncbi:hypothetical protein ACL1CN_10420 [Corynebacterium striatum]|nr:hypothetical protein [Corynebacterium striatum]HCG2985208.1 hypothetical protein [Corynebacterium striatum]HCG3001030.1 hypothetical protein [Corynebacterium striatum]HCG3016921.1 hypothetical protein [Corynebacterium striatum]HCG3143552.1 hypothetical protein [Corynebacterium striatum]
MRKIFSLTLIAAACSLAACGSSPETTETMHETPKSTHAKPSKVDPGEFETAIQVLNYLQTQNVTCNDTGSTEQGLTCSTSSVAYIVNGGQDKTTVKAMVDGASTVENTAVIYGDNWYITCTGITAPTACLSAGSGLVGYEKSGF